MGTCERFEILTKSYNFYIREIWELFGWLYVEWLWIYSVLIQDEQYIQELIQFALASVEFSLAQLLYLFEWELPNGVHPKYLDMIEPHRLTA